MAAPASTGNARRAGRAATGELAIIRGAPKLLQAGPPYPYHSYLCV